jgi:hypothetical protein
MKKKGHILLRNVDDIVRKNYLCQQLVKDNSIVSMVLKISCKMNQSETENKLSKKTKNKPKQVTQ